MLNSRMRRLFGSAALAAVMMLVPSCGSGTSSKESQDASSKPGTTALDGKALVEQLCTRCHDLSRVQKRKDDAAGWQQTVSRMESHGLSVTPEQKAAIVKYLAATYGK